MLISYLPDCASLRRRISSENRRKIKIFENGQRKFFRELDVVNLLQSVRVSKFVANNILTGRQKTLLQFQREYLVGSDSDATSSCDDHRL